MRRLTVLPLQEKLVEFVLRTCPGVFVQNAYIEEEVIGDSIGTDRETVYHLLLELAKRRIIKYIPGNDRPYIVYHQPRVPESYLHVDRAAYRDRRLSYMEKVDKMVGYVEAQECRQLYLMRYFGQEEKVPCGICDFCLSRKKLVAKPDKKLVMQKILSCLQESELGVRPLLEKLGVDRNTAVVCIRHLLEEGRIHYKTSEVLAIKSKG